MSAAELARYLADCAADALDRLAADMDKDAVIPAITEEGKLSRARILADDRNEAAGALERLSEALPILRIPTSSRRAQAAQGARDLRADRLANRPDLVRGCSASWRAFSDT